MIETLNKSVKFLPIGSAIMIVLGVYYTISYYNVFGVNILNYIELSEAILAFVENLEMLLLTALPFLIMDPLNRYLYLNQTDSHDEDEGKECDKLRVSLVAAFMAITTFIYSLKYFFLTFESKFLPVFLYYFLFTLAVFTVLIGLWFIYRSYYLKKTLMIYVLITIFLYAHYMAKASSYQVLSNKNEYSVKVKLKDNSDFLNKNFRFIGKTKNYTFVYDNMKKESLVYPNELIETYKVSRVDDEL